MREKEIRVLIRYACRRCECPQFARKDKIRVEFTDKLVSALGDAQFFAGEGYGLIRLHRKEWSGLNKAERTELVIHEVCHILADFKYGRRKNYRDHGPEWRALMQACGIVRPLARIEVDD